MEQFLCKKWDYRGELIDDYNCRLRQECSFDLGMLYCDECQQFKSEMRSAECEVRGEGCGGEGRTHTSSLTPHVSPPGPQSPERWKVAAAHLAGRVGYPLSEIADYFDLEMPGEKKPEYPVHLIIEKLQAENDRLRSCLGDAENELWRAYEAGAILWPGALNRIRAELADLITEDTEGAEVAPASAD